jgi:hypothetical protein
MILTNGNDITKYDILELTRTQRLFTINIYNIPLYK